MKKVSSLITLLLVVTNLYCQTTSEHLTTDYYLQKSKSQNKTGGILLGVGTTMILVGAIGFDKNFVMFEEGGDDAKAQIYAFVALAGVVVDIVSIPIFISASKNKKRAVSVAVGNQMIFEPNYSLTAFQKQPIPSLTLRMRF